MKARKMRAFLLLDSMVYSINIYTIESVRSNKHDSA